MGYRISKIDDRLFKDGIPVDIEDPTFRRIYAECQPHSFTTVEPMFALYEAIRYVVQNDIPGDFVECGVWKGGSAMLIAKTLQSLGATDRRIYLYDTFEGMSEPSGQDVDFEGNTAQSLMDSTDKYADKSVWCYGALDLVKQNLQSTGYPESKIVYVQGKVEDTIPATIPAQIALLRLDTDWYSSTYHELVHLYPILQKNGVLIIDDYGHWKGARDATNQYFREQNIRMLLHRTDYTVRTGTKI